MTTLSTRQTFALVALFVVTSLAFIQLDSRSALDPIKEGLYTVVSPAADAFGRVGRGSDGESALEQEVARLKAENSELLAENSRLKADTREVEQLRVQAGLREEHPDWQPLPARVRNPDPTNQQKMLVIDKGSADGVEVGMAVVAQGQNYIGQVTKVEEHTARVTLVIDVTHQVGARLEGGADGIVYGMWQKGQRLELRYLERDVKAEEGELVLTTASDAFRTARVPGDLIIGRVGDRAERNLQGDEQAVLVVPEVDFDQLRVVTVLLGNAA